MAALQWKDIPADILSVIAKLCNSDIYLLRIRSVCPSWRSSLPPPIKPFSFPLKVPHLLPLSNYAYFNLRNGYYTLHQSTVYRLSPPATGARAGDLSNGWLFKVSETTPNTISLHETVSTQKMYFPPGSAELKPRHLNLLDYRVSEICKSYTIHNFKPEDSFYVALSFTFIKVIALLNYMPGCDFAALVLGDDSSLSLWRIGDECWTLIDTKGHRFRDLILYDGKCYAVDYFGVVVSIDTDLNLTVAVASPAGYQGGFQTSLVECKSDLYVVSKINPGSDFVDGGKLTVYKFNKCKGKWDYTRDIGGMVFVLCEDVSFSVSPNDFVGFKGNTVYLNDSSFLDVGSRYAVGGYDLEDGSVFGLPIDEDRGCANR